MIERNGMALLIRLGAGRAGAAVFGLGILALAGCAAAPVAAPVVADAGSGEVAEAWQLPPSADGEISFAAVGDVMIGANVAMGDVGDVPAPSLDPAVRAVLRSTDLAIGNLEAVIAEGSTEVRPCGSSDNCYRFRLAPAAVSQLTEAGFGFLNLANNHDFDFGEAGQSATTAALDQAGIAYAGQDRPCCQTAVRTVRGRRIGLVGFAPHTGTLNLNDDALVARTIAGLRARSDLVVVAFHGGAEGHPYQHVPPGREFFLGADRGDVRHFAHRAIDQGADLVLGSGPHVPRALELYHGRLIAYSLGNFWTPRDVNLRDVNGLAPILIARLRADGGLACAQIVGTTQERGHRSPRLDPENQAGVRITELSRQDFGTASFKPCRPRGGGH